MSPIAEKLRVIVFFDLNAWVAQCLEHDIAASASDAESAKEELRATIDAELQYLRERGKDIRALPRAPKRFFELYDRASSFTDDSVVMSDGNRVNVKYAFAA
jgi:hypothetical protein